VRQNPARLGNIYPALGLGTVTPPLEAGGEILEIRLQIGGGHRLGPLIHAHGFMALEQLITCPSMLDVRNMLGQRREPQSGMRFGLLTYPCQVWVHRCFTPCRVSMFPLARVLARGTFHSTGMSRFLASPGPVPLQRPHLHRCCDVAGSYSGTACPRESLHARGAPLPLFGSLLSETPGARQALSLACTDAWLARRSIRSAVTQTVPFSGLCVRCRASTLHLAERPLPQQRFRAVGSTLPGKASIMQRTLAYFPSQ